MSGAGRRPLDGIRVVDLTHMLAGPVCTMVLADLGADVIKVEEPASGDPTRTFAPFQSGQSHYFMSINRGKRSVALDLKSRAGRTALRRLLAAADVFVENFRPTALTGLDLEPEQLAREFPDLIVCAISGFGLHNELEDKVSIDIVTQAMSGAMSINGEPNGPPMRLGLPMGDLAGGMYAVIAILGALVARERGVRPSSRIIDLSLQDSLVALLTYYATYAHVTGTAPGRSGSGHLTRAPYGVYEASDGYFVLAAFTDKMWPGTCRVIGREDLIDDPRFRDMAARSAHRAELDGILRRAFVHKSRDYWVQRFDEQHIPAGPVMDVMDVLRDPHLQARGMILEGRHPAYGAFRAIGDPLPFSRDAGREASPPPLLGEHTEEVLAELGYSQEEIAEIVCVQAGRSGASREPGVAPEERA